MAALLQPPRCFVGRARVGGFGAPTPTPNSCASRAEMSHVELSEFLSPQLETDNLDCFIVRSAILRQIEVWLPQMSGRLLDVGCGRMPYRSLLLSGPGQVREYLGLDFGDGPIHRNRPDICWLNGRIPLDDGAVNCALCTEVLEHCAQPEAVLKEVHRVLSPGGSVFLTTPFLWPLHEVPFDEYRYTPFALQRHLEGAGFSLIEVGALGGWDASLAQMIGLWVRRRPMSHWKRTVLSRVLRPVIGWLAARDHCPHEFGESDMITGLHATARKPK
jgi:SAM-dependent methyltransferase